MRDVFVSNVFMTIFLSMGYFNNCIDVWCICLRCLNGDDFTKAYFNVDALTLDVTVGDILTPTFLLRGYCNADASTRDVLICDVSSQNRNHDWWWNNSNSPESFGSPASYGGEDSGGEIPGRVDGCHAVHAEALRSHLDHEPYEVRVQVLRNVQVSLVHDGHHGEHHEDANHNLSWEKKIKRYRCFF